MYKSLERTLGIFIWEKMEKFFVSMIFINILDFSKNLNFDKIFQEVLKKIVISHFVKNRIPHISSHILKEISKF